LKKVKDLAGDFLREHKESIDWVLNSFSGKTASELELLSTILFVAKFQNPKKVANLVEQVELIKPHFSQEQIQMGFDELVGLKVLRTGPVQ
jgi:hypothetical protein